MKAEIVEHPRAVALDASTVLASLPRRDAQIVWACVAVGEARAVVAERFRLSVAAVGKIVDTALHRLRIRFPEFNPNLSAA